MKNYQLILIILLLFTGILSCKKDETEKVPEYPAQYVYSYATEPVVKVFAKNGEITSNEEVINRFKSYLAEKKESSEYKGITVTYISADTIQLQIDETPEEKIRTVHRYNGVTYWESQDTTKFPILNSSFVKSSLFKYSPIYYVEYNLPWTTGFRKSVHFKQCYYAVENNEKLIIPFIDFAGYTIENGAFVGTGFNNTFDENSILNFGLNDTVVIREYAVELEKIN
ncbi:hypothetical protein [Mariniphaga sediminis]|uniref:hypothetical protein n=1 Tax=Mariniphaga sediminis TaxID=1628158 RepID=UPI0035664840